VGQFLNHIVFPVTEVTVLKDWRKYRHWNSQQPLVFIVTSPSGNASNTKWSKDFDDRLHRMSCHYWMIP